MKGGKKMRRWVMFASASSGTCACPCVCAYSGTRSARLISVPVPDTVAFLSLFGVFVVPAVPIRKAGILIAAADSKVTVGLGNALSSQASHRVKDC
jgi:hypothetical protein